MDKANFNKGRIPPIQKQMPKKRRPAKTLLGIGLGKKKIYDPRLVYMFCS
jgi:hypothetical protein